MIEEKIFSKVCTETLEILANISDDEYDKIPPDFIEMLDKNSDKEYVFDINIDKEFNEQELLEETFDMLAYIYRKYWCDEKEKKEFKTQILNNNLKNEIEIQTINSEIVKEEIYSTKSLAISNKSSVFDKMKNMLQKLFRKK